MARNQFGQPPGRFGDGSEMSCLAGASARASHWPGRGRAACCDAIRNICPQFWLRRAPCPVHPGFNPAQHARSSGAVISASACREPRKDILLHSLDDLGACVGAQPGACFANHSAPLLEAICCRSTRAAFWLLPVSAGSYHWPALARLGLAGAALFQIHIRIDASDSRFSLPPSGTSSRHSARKRAKTRDKAALVKELHRFLPGLANSPICGHIGCVGMLNWWTEGSNP